MKVIKEKDKKKKNDSEEIRITNEWDASSMFSNTEIAKIYSAVENSIDIFFNFDLIDPLEEHIPAIYLIPKGSAEMAWIRVLEPDTQRFAMNLRANELFDPKDEGIIYLCSETHDTLARSLRAIAYILRERRKEE